MGYMGLGLGAFGFRISGFHGNLNCMGGTESPASSPEAPLILTAVQLLRPDSPEALALRLQQDPTGVMATGHGKRPI